MLLHNLPLKTISPIVGKRAGFCASTIRMELKVLGSGEGIQKPVQALGLQKVGGLPKSCQARSSEEKCKEAVHRNEFGSHKIQTLALGKLA
jgi:hypothetical protein